MKRGTRIRLGHVLLIGATSAFAVSAAVSIRTTNNYTIEALLWVCLLAISALALALAGTRLLSADTRQAISISIGIFLFTAPTLLGTLLLLTDHLTGDPDANIGAGIMVLLGNITLPIAGVAALATSATFAVMCRHRASA